MGFRQPIKPQITDDTPSKMQVAGKSFMLGLMLRPGILRL
jgi:hypothetical protein